MESIRISTRPDYIDGNQLSTLHQLGVRTIEIGAQSFNDDVLQISGRGHNAEAVEQAMQLLRGRGFQSGLHLMAGLPGETKESFLKSLSRTVELQPETVRIHPVIVFKDTPLADEYLGGRYRPLDLDEAVEWCRLAWEVLAPADIRIIRFGLHISREMGEPGAVLAGPVHPSLGTLVRGAVFYSSLLKLVRKLSGTPRTLHFRVAASDEAHFRGSGNSNILALKKLYPDAQIVIDSARGESPGVLTLENEFGKSSNVKIPGIQ